MNTDQNLWQFKRCVDFTPDNWRARYEFKILQGSSLREMVKTLEHDLSAQKKLNRWKTAIVLTSCVFMAILFISLVVSRWLIVTNNTEMTLVGTQIKSAVGFPLVVIFLVTVGITIAFRVRLQALTASIVKLTSRLEKFRETVTTQDWRVSVFYTQDVFLTSKDAQEALIKLAMRILKTKEHWNCTRLNPNATNPEAQIVLANDYIEANRAFDAAWTNATILESVPTGSRDKRQIFYWAKSRRADFLP